MPGSGVVPQGHKQFGAVFMFGICGDRVYARVLVCVCVCIYVCVRARVRACVRECVCVRLGSVIGFFFLFIFMCSKKGKCLCYF